jgi:hypothetical protein
LRTCGHLKQSRRSQPGVEATPTRVSAPPGQGKASP